MGVLKYHGGKHYLAKAIRAFFPPHVHYVEPFAGSLAVLLAGDGKGVSEVVNDVDGHLMNFWRTLRDRPREMVSRLFYTPFSKPHWEEAATQLNDPDPVVAACAYFIHLRMSMSGRGRSFAPLSKTRTRGGMNEQVSAYLSSIPQCAEVKVRLEQVVLYNENAIEVIKREDGPKTLFYCDPPYPKETRTSPEVYAHEMTFEEHAELLEVLDDCQGAVILSGYDNALYNERLAGWRREEIKAPNHAAKGEKKRLMTEVLWIKEARS